VAIEEALFRNNVPFRNVSKQYGVTPSALFRHKQHAPESKQQSQTRKSPDSEQQVPTGAQLAAELPPRKQRYVEERIAGKTRRAAALDAGYSTSMASHAAEKIETADVRQAFSALVRETIPPERIAKAISEGLGAMETKFFSSEGSVTDTRDVIAWSERRAYAEMAASYGGYWKPEPKDADTAQGGVIVVLPRPAHETQTAETGVVIEGRTKVQFGEGVIVALPKGSDAEV